MDGGGGGDGGRGGGEVLGIESESKLASSVLDLYEEHGEYMETTMIT